MRKFLIFILSIILLVSTSLLLVGCKDNSTYNPNEGKLTITYYDGISSESKTCLIPKETLVKDFYVLKKDGCKFLGFYDNSVGGLQIFDETGEQKFPLISNTTLYAQWEKTAYSKSFVVNATYGDPISDPYTVYAGDIIENLPTPTVKSGYEFYGWRIGSEGTVISDGGEVKTEYQEVGSATKDIWLNNTKFYAEIGKKRYNVTLHYNDGETPDEVIKVTHGGKVENLPDLFSDSESKRDFRGWSAYDDEYKNYTTAYEFNNVTDDLHVYAYWRQYKIINLVVTEDNVLKDKVYEDEVYEFSTNYNKPGFEPHAWWDSENFINSNKCETLLYTSIDDMSTYYLEWYVNSNDYITGTGTKSDPYTINSVYQLQQITYHLDCHYQLAGDIDISHIYNWSPIGGSTGDGVFTGSLDGAGYSIIGLKRSSDIEVNTATAKGYFGLFGCIGEGATIERLNLTSVSISVSSSTPNGITYYGAVAGSIEGAIIDEVIVSGSIQYYNTSKKSEVVLIGGICGRAIDAEIICCENNATIYSANLNTIVAGIVAYASGGEISECKNTATITAKIYGKNGYAYAAVICAATSNYNEVTCSGVVTTGTASAARYTISTAHTGTYNATSTAREFALVTGVNY